MKKAFLIDSSKCTGCRACQVACKQWNQLPAEQTTFTGDYENPPRFSPHTWTKIAFNEHGQDDQLQWFFTKLGCMHCTDAACIKVCPAGAITKTEYGSVVIDPKRCIGCNYCAANCTYQVIGFDQTSNVARKCDFCYDRVSNGLVPACAKTCPTGAITFGDRSALVTQAERRLHDLKLAGHTNATVYGLEELNGLGVIYVLKDRPEKYGLPEEPRVSTAAHIWDVLFKPVRVVVVLAMLVALWVNKDDSKKQDPA